MPSFNMFRSQSSGAPRRRTTSTVEAAPPVPYSSSRRSHQGYYTTHHHRHHSAHNAFVATNTSPATSSGSSSTLYSLPSNSSPYLRDYRKHGYDDYPSKAMPAIKMHPLLTYSRHSPRVAYNILFAPSHSNIIHPETQTAVSSHTLNLPATSPRTSELHLSSPHFPWTIRVVSTTSPDHAITNLDVIEAVYKALRKPVAREEWNSLGSAQRAVADAYEDRCSQLGGDLENGVRRSDFLTGRVIFLGVESRPNGPHRLIMGR